MLVCPYADSHDPCVRVVGSFVLECLSFQLCFYANPRIGFIIKIFMRFMLTFAWRSKSASAQQCIIKQVAIRIKRYFRLRMIFSALSTMAALSEFHLFYS